MTVWRVMPFRKQSASGVWILPSLMKNSVGAGGLGDLAAPVEHHGVGIALGLGRVLGDACRSCRGRRPSPSTAMVRGSGRRHSATSRRMPFMLLRRIEIARPLPDGDRRS